LHRYLSFAIIKIALAPLRQALSHAAIELQIMHFAFTEVHNLVSFNSDDRLNLLFELA